MKGVKMKNSFRKFMLSALVASQFVAGQSFAGSLESFTEQVTQKLKNLNTSGSVGLDLVSLNLTDNFGVNNGFDYRYTIQTDREMYFRQDKWTDFIVFTARAGVLDGSRQYRRDVAFGRFYNPDKYGEALRTLMFSPLDLRGIGAEKILRMIDDGKLLPGDALMVTLDKGTFLGLGAGVGVGTTAHASVGQSFVGKITVKIFVQKDKKLIVTFSDADSTSIVASAEVKIDLALAKLKILGINNHFNMRGTADLATFTYDLSQRNPQAMQALENILGALDKPFILFDQNSAKQLFTINPGISKGLIDITASEKGASDITSGITKIQEVTNNMVDGSFSRFKIILVPSFLEWKDVKSENVNLLDIKKSQSFVTPGKYIVGYKNVEDKDKSPGKNKSVVNTTSFVYKPSPGLKDSKDASGYRGLSDLIGISYHTDAKEMENPKEMVTYSKLCNAGLVNCPNPVRLGIVFKGSKDAKAAEGKTSINSNYFFSKGMFEKIKARLNWSTTDKEEDKKRMIRESIDPVVREMVLQPEYQDGDINSITNMLFSVLQYDCYSNLVGIRAKVKEDDMLKSFVNPSCYSNLYSIKDELVRMNMPTLLISLFDPTILPPLSDLNRRAKQSQIDELAKYFSVTFSSRAKQADGTELSMENDTYGMSLLQENNAAAQISEFVSLISIWQQQEHLTLSPFDRATMVNARK